MMFLCETWIDKKGWERVSMKLPKGYVWMTQWASRKNKKGRAMGRLCVGIRVEIEMEKGTEEGKEGLMTVKIWLGKEEWRLVGIYVNNDLEMRIEDMRKWIEEKGEKERVLIGDDFNARKRRRESGEGRYGR